MKTVKVPFELEVEVPDEAEYVGFDEDCGFFWYKEKPQDDVECFDPPDDDWGKIKEIKNWKDTLTKLPEPEIDWSKVKPGTLLHDEASGYDLIFLGKKNDVDLYIWVINTQTKELYSKKSANKHLVIKED